MRGSGLLAIGAALLIVALCFAGAVSVYAMSQGGQEEAAGPHTPVGVDRSEPAQPLKRALPKATPAKKPVVEPSRAGSPPSEEQPQPEPAPRVTELPPQSGQSGVSGLHGDAPPADTRTMVGVPACGGGTLALNAAEKKMLDLHNAARRAHSLEPLCLSPVLTRHARERSQDMLDRDYFSHYAPPNGTTVIDQLKQEGYYELAGENIHRGGDATDTDTPGYGFGAFMRSEGHRENVLRPGFDEVGVGARSGTYRNYDDTSTIYTVVFGGKR